MRLVRLIFEFEAFNFLKTFPYCSHVTRARGTVNSPYGSQSKYILICENLNYREFKHDVAAWIHQAENFWIINSSFSGSAPTISSSFLPALKTRNVGIAEICCSLATSASSSTSTLKKRVFFDYSSICYLL